MKKVIFIFALLCIALQAAAIPAKGRPTPVKQPDGTTLTIKLIGDEFYHYNTTADGYTIVQNDEGVYVYAQKVNDKLQPTNIKAHDIDARTAAEKSFLEGAKKYITDREEHKDGEAMRAKRDAKMGGPQKAMANVKNFHGVIILVNFSDVKFSMSNPKQFYTDMFNKEGFNGFDWNGKHYAAAGSTHDYFKESSRGNFCPTFDILGPYNCGQKSTYPGGKNFGNTQKVGALISAAMSAYDSQTDYTKYDNDGNGSIDMVYVIFAGNGAQFDGNNSNFVWPHASSMAGFFDGKSVSRYACSNEIYGWTNDPNTLVVDGIGTFCHEFSHTLGLPDLYDTNDDTGGLSHDPGGWDLMAGGTEWCSSRYPALYSMWERAKFGWANPATINQEGVYSLRSLSGSGDGYRINSANSGEYFLLENRQNTGFDTYLPGHGMIVARIEGGNWSMGSSVNTNASHNLYELIRAGKETEGDHDSDPFPGSKGVAMLGPSTSPALAAYNGKTTDLNLIRIMEDNGTVSFRMVKTANIKTLKEDFEKMPASTDKNQKGVEGVFANWDFTKCNVTAPGSGLCNGKQAVAMYSGTAFTCAEPIFYNTYFASNIVVNQTPSDAKYTLSYTTDGTTWTRLKDVNGNDSQEVPSMTNKRLYWALDFDKDTPVRYRITEISGNKSKATYVDDLMIYYLGSGGEKPALPGDVNNSGLVDIVDLNILINIVLGQDSANNYGGRADLNKSGMVDIVDVNAMINLILGI